MSVCVVDVMACVEECPPHDVMVDQRRRDVCSAAALLRLRESSRVVVAVCADELAVCGICRWW